MKASEHRSYLTGMSLTETSLYVASLYIAAQNVCVVKRKLHNKEKSQNEEVSKRKGVRNIFLMLHYGILHIMYQHRNITFPLSYRMYCVL